MSLADLEKKLRYHDWNYSYSDDYSVVRRGERAWDELKVLIEKFPRDDVRPLWEKHCPDDYKGKFDIFFPKFAIVVKGRKHHYITLDAAKKAASEIFNTTGIVVGIEGE